MVRVRRGGPAVPARGRGGFPAVPAPRRGGRARQAPRRLHDNYEIGVNLHQNPDPNPNLDPNADHDDAVLYDEEEPVANNEPVPIPPALAQAQQQLRLLEQNVAFLTAQMLVNQQQQQPEQDRQKQHSKLKLKAYDGGFDYRTYRSQFTNVAALHNWSRAEKKAQLLNAATGKAADILSDLPEDATFEQIDDMLAKHFDQSKTSWQALHEIDSASRKPDETIRAFARRVEHLIKVANPDAGPITPLLEGSTIRV